MTPPTQVLRELVEAAEEAQGALRWENEKLDRFDDALIAARQALDTLDQEPRGSAADWREHARQSDNLCERALDTAIYWEKKHEAALSDLAGEVEARAAEWRGKARANAIVDGPEERYADCITRADECEAILEAITARHGGEGRAAEAGKTVCVCECGTVHLGFATGCPDCGTFHMAKVAIQPAQDQGRRRRVSDQHAELRTRLQGYVDHAEGMCFCAKANTPWERIEADLIQAINALTEDAELREAARALLDEMNAAGFPHDGCEHCGELVKAEVRLRAALTPDPQAERCGTKVITLCGSTRFPQAFALANMHLSLQGHIVIGLGMQGHADEPQGARFLTSDGDESKAEKKALDSLHFRKIDLADEIFVVNVGGYIGSSTRREIAYARSQGKAVAWMFPDAVPEVPELQEAA